MPEANNFHALRLMAASTVLFGHAFALHALLRCEPLMGCRGGVPLENLGLYTFFVISGFLVTESWQRDAHVLRFLARRALRIFPGLAIAVVFTALVIGPMATALPLPDYFASAQTWAFLRWAVLAPNTFLLPAVFLGNPVPLPNGALWTLPIEFRLYVAIAVLGLLGAANRVGASVALVAAIAGCWLVGGQSYPLAGFFAAGAALYMFRARIRFRIEIAAILALAVAIFPQPQLFTLLALPYIVLGFALNPIGRLPRLADFGDISYGVYLYAYPVQQMVERLRPDWGVGAQIAVAVPFVVMLALLSWRLIEAPMLRFKPTTMGGFVPTRPQTAL